MSTALRAPGGAAVQGTPATIPVCPTCGKEAALTTTRHGVRAECCGLWSWNLKPLADAETHKARIAAHDAFDRLWRAKMVRDGVKKNAARTAGYRWLAERLGLTVEECHMAQMDAATARRVVEVCRPYFGARTR